MTARSVCDRSSATRTCSRSSSNALQIGGQAVPPTSRSPRPARCGVLSLRRRSSRRASSRSFELARRFLEALDLDGEAARALDQRGMRRLGLGGLAPLLLHRFARIEQPALRGIQLLVGGALLDLDPADRRTRFVLPRVLRAQLLLGGAALVRDLILLARQALGGLAARHSPGARSRRSTFSWRCSSPCIDMIADSAPAMTTSSLRDLFA